jgi:hypothetical protein
MIIANPIYDVVFKRLMEDEKVAKFFIGTLLDQRIEAIEVKPQEFTFTDKLAGLAVFRLDFIATVIMDDGEQRKVLIEIQKAKNPIDLMRFRNYLAEQYKKEDKVNEETVILPITTIYILGFKLPEIESSCIRVKRDYVDMVTKTTIDHKSEFIEKLTHDCFVVQVDRIADRYQTRLDKMLSVFEQRNFTDEKEITKDYKHQPDLEEIKTITEILHYVGTNPEERKQIEIEREAWRSVNAMFEEKERKYQRELEEHRKALSEKDHEITEMGQVISEKDHVISEKDKLIEELLKKLNQQQL